MNREKTLSQVITATDEGMRVWQQERAIFEITERICELMSEQNISRSDLAALLKTTRGYITKLLDGSNNMTIRKISDVYLALGRQFHPHDEKISIDNVSPVMTHKVSFVVSREEHANSRAHWGWQEALGINAT